MPPSATKPDLVPKLVLGTAQFGMNYGVANRGGQVTVEEASKIIEAGQRIGIDTLDTAEAYGNSEEIIGQCFSNLRHKNIRVITKVSDRCVDIDERIRQCYRRTSVRPKALLAHSAALFSDTSFQLALGRFRDRDPGIKIGVSLYNEREINQVLRAKFPPEIVQVPLNILDSRLYHSGILGEIKGRRIEVHARSIFLQGLFYLPLKDVSVQLPAAVPYLAHLSELAGQDGLTVSEMSLLWVASLEEVDRILIGVDNCAQLFSHLTTLGKDVNPETLNRALSLKCEQESVLNPSLWK